jgi:hypothetical protein
LGLQCYFEGVTAKFNPVIDKEGNSSKWPDNGEQGKIS